LKQRVRELREEGKSLREIEDELGVDHVSASRLLKEDVSKRTDVQIETPEPIPIEEFEEDVIKEANEEKNYQLLTFLTITTFSPSMKVISQSR
jgi:transcriptional regulator with XRE-family HTH domain